MSAELPDGAISLESNLKDIESYALNLIVEEKLSLSYEKWAEQREALFVILDEVDKELERIFPEDKEPKYTRDLKSINVDPQPETWQSRYLPNPVNYVATAAYNGTCKVKNFLNNLSSPVFPEEMSSLYKRGFPKTLSYKLVKTVEEDEQLLKPFVKGLMQTKKLDDKLREVTGLGIGCNGIIELLEIYRNYSDMNKDGQRWNAYKSLEQVFNALNECWDSEQRRNATECLERFKKEMTKGEQTNIRDSIGHIHDMFKNCGLAYLQFLSDSLRTLSSGPIEEVRSMDVLGNLVVPSWPYLEGINLAIQGLSLWFVARNSNEVKHPYKSSLQEMREILMKERETLRDLFESDVKLLPVKKRRLRQM